MSPKRHGLNCACSPCLKRQLKRQRRLAGKPCGCRLVITGDTGRFVQCARHKAEDRRAREMAAARREANDPDYYGGAR